MNELPSWMDAKRAGKIAQLRALGYSQREIADRLGISQQTVSRYLKGINEAAEESGQDVEDFLSNLILVGLSAAAIVGLFKLLQGNTRGPRL